MWGDSPRDLSTETLCCVGFVFCSPTTPRTGTRDTCTQQKFAGPTLNWNWRMASRNGALSMSPTTPAHMHELIASGSVKVDRPACPHQPACTVSVQHLQSSYKGLLARPQSSVASDIMSANHQAISRRMVIGFRQMFCCPDPLSMPKPLATLPVLMHAAQRCTHLQAQ